MTEQLPLTTTPTPAKLRVEDYLLLDGSGALDRFGKTELIEGEIFYMNAQHRPHARAKTFIYDALRDGLRAIRSRLIALVEASVSMPDDSVPEPDIVVTSEPDGDGLVPLASVMLLVEVADTSLAHDRRRKLRLYARNFVPGYWIVDVNAALIHQLWSPEDDRYAGEHQVRFGEPLHAETIAGLRVETTAL